MTPRIILATAARVLAQLRHDRRTIALILVVPCLLIALMRYVFDGADATFQRVGVPLIGIFPLVTLFLVTSIAMLRERTTGTLERLMTMPLRKPDLLFGYGLAFGLVAIVQAAVITSVAVGLLGLDVHGSIGLVFALAVLNALLGNALGLLVSAFAATEFQAVQFMPAFLFPQILLCGIFGPRDQMAPVLSAISDALPMTYAYDGLTRVAQSSTVSGRLLADLAVVGGSVIIALALGAATLRRRTG